ncbi:MAG: glutathione S-transferase family protein [Pseudomonadaceae bacterium]|nr:glutathione S-transferase family protein [Pseudomonadaceae bacterium]
MSITIYGQSGSRALRALWMAEELGIDYEHVPTTFAKQAKEPEFLAINPNGRVPTLVDGELTVWESMAINLHLARRFGGPLAPSDDTELTLAEHWSFWVMTEVEKTLLQAMFHGTGMFGVEKSQDKVAEQLALLDRPLAVLNDVLADKEYLVGNRFTVADLNVASVMVFAEFINETFEAYANVQAWLARCYGRDALARAKAKP